MINEQDLTPDQAQTHQRLSEEAALRGLHEAIAEFCRVRVAAQTREGGTAAADHDPQADMADAA